MRELKFRVWSEEDKEYRTDLNVFRLHDGKIICTSPAYSLEGDRFDVEQYTGLKDKNGKEIYEGDIIRIDSMDEMRVGYVDLVNDQYCIVCGEDDEGNKIVAEFYYYSKPEENCEVIGNIHENQDLLGDTNVTNIATQMSGRELGGEENKE